MSKLIDLLRRAADSIEEGHNTENVHRQLALIRELRDTASLLADINHTQPPAPE